jgi:hypothetical protein
MRRRLSLRRGLSALEWAFVAGAIFLVVLGTVVVLGNRTNNKMNETATDLADPTKLPARFGSK